MRSPWGCLFFDGILTPFRHEGVKLESKSVSDREYCSRSTEIFSQWQGLEDLSGVKNRSIHTDPFHGRAIRCLDSDHAARATTDATGHELFQGYLAG